MLAVKRSGAGRAAMTAGMDLVRVSPGDISVMLLDSARFSMDTAVARYVEVLVGASARVSR
jgi:hypothetical protein